MSHAKEAQKRVSFYFLSSGTIFFKATLQKREKISNTKILIKSTDFDVNIFLLWHLEVDRYIYYRQLRGKRRYSKGTSCNLYFGLFFMIIYFYFFSDVFLYIVFSGTSFVSLWRRTIFFRSSYRSWKNILCRKLNIVRRIQVQQQTTNKRYLIFQSQYRLVAAFI